MFEVTVVEYRCK